MGAIEKAQLAIFTVFLFPACWVFYKHGRPGFLGWLYVVLFCVIRIIGTAMLIYYEQKGVVSEVALIISSLGLSPLLLSSVSILHEARRARNHKIRGCCEWFLVLSYHGFQAAGIALIASRGTSLALSLNQRSSADQTILEVGLAIIDICWVCLALGILISLVPHRKDPMTYNLYAAGSKLLYFVLVNTCLILLRMIYATVYYTTSSASFQNSLAVKVCLSVVPEMLVTFLYLFVGIQTQDMHKRVRKGLQ